MADYVSTPWEAAGGLCGAHSCMTFCLDWGHSHLIVAWTELFQVQVKYILGQAQFKTSKRPLSSELVCQNNHAKLDVG